MNHIIISFLGTDRPGLVETLSNIIKKHNGNWQNSSLHHLSGTFAGVIEVAASEDDINAIDNAVKSIDELNVSTQITTKDSVKEDSTITLELTANDRAGIVQDISSIIHRQGGNLIKLVSKQGLAPHTGQAMFNAKAQVAVAENQTDILIEALEDLADDLMVDISR